MPLPTRAPRKSRIILRLPDSRRDRMDAGLATLGWALLALFLAVTVAPGLTGSRVFLGTDILTDFNPWAVVDGNAAINPNVWDTVDSAAPMAILIVDSVRAGDFPLWDPYTNGGTILAALPNSGLLSPLSLPWWILPHTAAPAGVKIMEMLAVGLGMHLLLRRRWGLARLTVPFATLVYATSGFMISWTNWPQTRVAALIPLLFWAVDRLALEHRWREAVPLGLIVSSMLLGGFPAILVYSLYAAIPYFIVRSLAEHVALREMAMSVLRSAAGVVLGVLLAAVQILPFIWQSLHYIDFGARTANNEGSLPAQSLATVLTPFLLGGPETTETRSIVHPVEGLSYLGAVAVVLVAAVLVLSGGRGPGRGVSAYFMIALLVVTVAVYSDGPVNDALQALPGIGMSPIGRLRALLGFFAAVLAAIGLSRVFEPDGLGAQIARWRSRGALGAVAAVTRVSAAALLVLPLLLIAFRWQDPDDVEQSWSMIKAALLVTAITGLALLAAWARPRRALSAATVALCLALTTAGSIDVAHRWWPLAAPDTFYATTPTHDFLDENLGPNRYVSVYTAMMPGTSTVYRQRALSGHAFVSPQWRTTMQQVDHRFFQTPTYSILPVGAFLEEDVDSGVLDRFAVTYVVAPMSEYFPGLVEGEMATQGTTTLRADGRSLRSGALLGPVRGIVVQASQAESLSLDDGVLTVRLVSERSGEVLAQSVSDVTGAPGIDGYIAVAGEDIAADEPWRAELSLSGTRGSLDLATNGNGELAALPYRPVDDDLKLVHAGDAIVFERLTSLDRVRWASSEVVIEDEQQRLEQLENGGLDAETVVLEHPSDARGANGGSSATIHQEDLGTDAMELTVTTDGPGWVVVADPMRDGWSASLDGQQVELVDAEGAGVAIYVPHAGSHTIRLEYHAPWFTAGLAVTAATWAALVAAAGWMLMRRRTGAAPDRDPSPTPEGGAREAEASARARRRRRG